MVDIPLSPTACALVTMTILALTFYAGRWCGVKLVNEEICRLGDTGTFADLAGIDKKLGLPKGSSWEMGGYADYYAFEED